MPLYLEDWQNGEAKKRYETQEFADITQSPIPDFSLLKVDQYLYSIVQYSRGCPYACDFCEVTTLFNVSLLIPERIYFWKTHSGH